MKTLIDTDPGNARPSKTPASMKLVVLGATGGTGLELVRQAIEHGHSVTALVRSPDRLRGLRDRITIQQGDLLNRAELEQAIEGHDAVLSGFGPRVNGIVDRKSTRLNSSHLVISYAVFCLK